ncbi:g5393 [Coccomyxa viridis]|uniref:G5393 protein n=1 Tax=Coccomyxa viridis TaxID=1274662 RepID=A0ABP1FSQ7_9CHLO
MIFHSIPLCELNRWLLRRIEGVLILEHDGMEEEEEPYSELPDEANRDQQIVLTTLPLLSGLLSREAGLHPDLNWVMMHALFPGQYPNFETQFWSTVSTAVTRLHIQIEERRMTREFSAVLCQLTRLEQLEIGEVDLVYVGLMSLCEMPSSIRGLSLSLSEESVPLRELFPAHTAESLEEVMILEDEHHYADSDTIKAWCLNGKLRTLDPFLSMLRLERLELQSRLGLAVRAGGRVSLWTPPALRLLGLAEKRIRQMQRTSPGRTITLIY